MSEVVEATVEIARPPREVFEDASDASHLPAWRPAVQAAETQPPGR